jgi:hypothetical protein
VSLFIAGTLSTNFFALDIVIEAAMHYCLKRGVAGKNDDAQEWQKYLLPL